MGGGGTVGILGTECVFCFFSTDFVRTIFAPINIYSLTPEIRSEAHVCLHVISGIVANQNWNMLSSINETPLCHVS
jgi:hypothetical protein